MTPKEPRPERKKTDDSLADERANTDQILDEKISTIEERADVVIERARVEADDVLTAARAKADEKLTSRSGQTMGTVAEDRAREDRKLEAERAEADEILRKERVARARVLARLLPLERDKTDQYLLTERARSDAALANRDDFLGMVSHDLRDLLNGIVVNAAFIKENVGVDEPGKGMLTGAQRIERSAGRMGRLIGDLVDIASIDAGKLAVLLNEADAADVVLEAVETWGPPAATKGVALEAVAHGPVVARFDHERVLQVLGNLITNAVKFSARGGKVVVSVERAGDAAQFSVRDNGSGIPGDKLEAIFERFWQVGNDRRGLGLGLYISRCLVTAHGGKIWAESEIDVGSTFIFTIPRALSAASS